MTSYHDQLITYLERYTTLTEAEKEILRNHIQIRTVPKGTILLKPGQVSRECHFVLEGCARQYTLLDGAEKTTDFFTEYQPMVSFTSFIQEVPAEHYWECIEDCVVTVGTKDSEKDMFERFPRLERIVTHMVGENFGKEQDRLAGNLVSNPETRYLQLLKDRPGLSNRVPQYQLASYIGVTPESLSRIRKRVLLNS